MTFTRRKLLVVSPVFHGYWRAIERSFAELGFDVLTHRYDEAPRTEKLYNKLRHELPAQLTGSGRHLSDTTVTHRALRALDDARPDLLLVVRGDVLQESFWERAASLRIPVGLWLYDELRRMRHDPARLTNVARIATYSAGDVRALAASGITALHIPLAFDSSLEIPERAASGEVTFIGARFPRREHFIRHLVSHGIPTRAYGRDWSDRLADRARTWRTTAVAVPSSRDVPLAEGYSLMRAGLATLNIHGDQDGFTMRTFEAGGVGAVQLIDRADVEEFYTPGEEILTFDTPEELVDQCRRVIHDGAGMTRLREAARRRTLAQHTFRHRAEALQELWVGSPQ